jgi:glycine dehydrogenase subunit 1
MRPSVIDYLVIEADFLPLHTPYQPEASQGTLQAVFEFQSMISGLMGMGVPMLRSMTDQQLLWKPFSMAARLQKKSSGEILIL